MTQFYAGNKTVIYTAQYDLSGFFNAADATRSWVELDTTTFGQDAKTRIAGQADGTAKLAGLYSGDAGGVEAALNTLLGSAAGEPASLGMIGDALVGNPAYVWLNRWAHGGTKSAFGGLVQTDAEFQAARGGLGPGFWVHPKGVETAGGNTAAGIDGTAATTTGWRAALHVFTITGTGTPTLNAKLQDSANNSAWADLGSGAFTAVTTVGGQFLQSATATATVRRYVRLLWTITGTNPNFTFAVSFARYAVV